MSLRSRILIGFILVTAIPVTAGALNLFFFVRMNRAIDELVETRFGIEQKVQSGHLIINRIYNQIWDALLLDMDSRPERIRDLDDQALAFFRIMDALSRDLPHPTGVIREQKRRFQTFYILGKDVLGLPNLSATQHHQETMERFKRSKDRLTDQMDKRFEGYKKEFVQSLSDLQADTYVIAAFSILSVIFSAMAALILSIRWSAGLVRPVLDLTSAIRRFTSGEPGIPARESPDDEIGRLGSAFNEMTRQLNESIDNLKTQIMERRHAEKEALRRREQLIQADRMASLGILVSGVAHEINNPNQFILSHIEPLKNAWEGAIPVLDRYYEQYGDFRLGGTNYSLIRDRIPRIFSNISAGSNRIKAIVDELKDFVNQRPQMVGEQVDLNDIVESALKLVSTMIRQSTRRFSFFRGQGLPPVTGHYHRLEQVVVNLVQNACQALTSPEEAVFVRTGYDGAEGCIRLEVTDQGVGIPEADKAHLSDPFFTTKREKGGTGLGLSIVSRIVADHNGSMIFEPGPDKGTKVIVKFPVHSDNHSRKD